MVVVVCVMNVLIPANIVVMMYVATVLQHVKVVKKLVVRRVWMRVVPIVQNKSVKIAKRLAMNVAR